ncbi:MAG: PAS domain-containing protein [Deltaproteobacteria bacterium]|nr:PAS domain-containing protein [Deltaproteobacteria bacterium]
MYKAKRHSRGYWVGIPPWIIIGSAIILFLIFIFWTAENINKQREGMSLLLLEKGAALIRSFEAGARTGMMGMMGRMMEMHGRGFRLQRLLTETAQQPDIVHIIVTDEQGKILAHSDPSMIGEKYGNGLDLRVISRSLEENWRLVPNSNGPDIFEVYRRFSPQHPPMMRSMGRMMLGIQRAPKTAPTPQDLEPGQIIFVGLDMGPVEQAIREDTRHTIIMALILLLIGVAGIFSLFLAQAYRSAKSSLTRIKAFSDNVVENMPIGLVATDADGRIASCNHEAEALLRKPAADILGKKAGEVLPSQFTDLLADVERDRGIIQREMEISLGDSKRIPLDVSVSPLESEDGLALGNIILFRDLTEIRALKREVETSQRLASLGRLAAGVAHEIRNPLSSIKGFATYFKERYKDNPEDRNTAQIMVQEVERLNRVIGELLEFARPVKMKKKRILLQTLIRHSLKMVERQAQEKGVRVEMDLADDVKEIFLDPDRINQVLLNLYLNAFDAMERGGLLRVRLSGDENAGMAAISVSDTGKGISKQDLAHVFDPYFTTKQSGTGLGLAIVHRIIESHGGEVKVESQMEMGTTVRIFLPLDTSQEKDL